MSLAKASVPIVFQGGLDQKTDPKISVSGKFQKLENCIREKTGRIQKRYGLSNMASGAGIGATASSIVSFDDAPVIMGTTGAYNYGATADVFRSAASTYLDPVHFDSASVYRDNGVQTGWSAASGGGYTFTCFVEMVTAGGIIRYVVTEDATGVRIKSGTVATAAYPAGGLPSVRVHYIGTSFVIIYQDGSTLKGVVATATNGPTGATFSLVTPVSPNDSVVFDTCVVDSTRIGFVTPKGSAAGYTVGYITLSGGSLSVTSSASTSVAGSVRYFMSIGYNSKYSTLYVIFGGTADTAVHVTAWNAALSASTSVSFDTISGVSLTTACSGITFDSSNDSAYVFYGAKGATKADDSIKWVSLTTTWSTTSVGTLATTTSPASTLFSCALHAKPFRVNNVPYLVVTTSNALQGAYYIMKAFSNAPLAQIGYGYGAGYYDNGGNVKSQLVDVVVNGEGKYVFPVGLKTKAQVVGTSSAVLSQGVNTIAVDFAATNTRNYAQAGRSLVFAGGVPTMWDGASGAELPFLTYPEGVSCSAVAGASTAGTYQLRFVYEWVDAKGQVYRSAPSVTQTVTTTAAQKISATVPTLIFSGLGTNVTIVPYVTTAGDSTFYRTGAAAGAVQLNSQTAGSVTFFPTTPNGTEEILYTTGGTLDNVGLPACSCVRYHKNRIWAGGLEDGTVAYSREMTAGEGVAFSDSLRIAMDGTGGNVTAFGSLDDKLLIFKKRKTYYIYGEGPLDSGLQSDYPLPQILSHDIGCSDPNLVVEGPFGVMFKSERGFYLINRGMALNYVGGDVEDFNDLTFTSAVVLADRQEVRFTTAEGTGLVYNYEFRQWSTFSNYVALSATYSDGVYYILRDTSGHCVKEASDTYDDAGTRYSMTIETSWLSLAGLQGFQRCYSFELLGDLISNHYTEVSFAYDFETTYNETITYDTRDLDTSVYQVEFRPKRQKCDAIKLKIVDTDTIGVTSGGSLNLVAVTASVGRKMGTNRLPATRKA